MMMTLCEGHLLMFNSYIFSDMILDLFFIFCDIFMLKKFKYTCIYVSVCMCAMCMQCLWVPRGTLHLLKLQAVLSHLMWVLGILLGSSVRAVSALNHWTIFPAHNKYLKVNISYYSAFVMKMLYPLVYSDIHYMN